MKKFIFIIIILALLGGTVLYFGWAQQKVPPGSYGVMRSKTHGVDENIIRDGEFRWIWYKLIPTNVQISVFTLRLVKYSIRNTGNLSSGDVYAAAAGVNADFSWEFSGELNFSLKPESLPVFTARENINDDAGLRDAEDRLAGKIGNFALQKIKSYIDSGDEKKLESLIMTGSLPELNLDILEAFPDIDNLDCTIKVFRSPDFALYEALREMYRELLSRQTALISGDILKESENRMGIKSRMDELANYGELLTKYPILLEYLAIEKGFPPAAAHEHGER